MNLYKIDQNLKAVTLHSLPLLSYTPDFLRPECVVHARTRTDLDESMTLQDVHADMPSDNLNIAANNSLIFSGLKFREFIFDEKYSENMDKFTTAGLSSNIYFRGALLFAKEEKSKREKNVSIGSINVDVHEEFPT